MTTSPHCATGASHASDHIRLAGSANGLPMRSWTGSATAAIASGTAPQHIGSGTDERRARAGSA